VSQLNVNVHGGAVLIKFQPSRDLSKSQSQGTRVFFLYVSTRVCGEEVENGLRMPLPCSFLIKFILFGRRARFVHSIGLM
jgi:hypothetical protein